MTTTLYEWDCETVVDGDSPNFENGEVVDHVYGASYKEVTVWSAANPPEAGFQRAIVLVRDADEGRSWAYLAGGNLPPYFKDAYGINTAKVPARFIREVEERI